MYWSLYVIFAGEIPEGLQNKNTFWIGMMLIASNSLLLAGIIGSVSSYIMEKFKNITDFDNLPNSENLVIIFNNDEDYKSLILLLENLKNFEIVNHNTYIYHKDTNTAFIAMNILNYLGKDFARKKLFVLTNTDIVNIPNAHVVRSYEIISKLINIEISIPHIGLVEQFLLSFHNRLKEIPVYGCTLIGYLDIDNKFINLLPMYQKVDEKIIEYSQIKSFLVMK